MERIRSEIEASRDGPRWADRAPVPRNVVDRLERLILDGTLKAGDRLPSQRELATTLGVSRPSLREALTALETLGLVVVRPGLGVFVQDPQRRQPVWRFGERGSPADVYDARICLESHAAQLAAARLDPAGLHRLESIVGDLATAFARHDMSAATAADAAFHDAIFELCGNRVLAEMYRAVREIMIASQRLPLAVPETLADTLAEHRTILEAFASGDPARAGAAMEAHIRQAALRFGIDRL